MRYARGMAVIMAFSLMGGVLPQLEKLPLIESGKARCCIVLPSPASDSLMYTARELQTYLYKMTGVTVPIRKVTEAIDGLPIYVGDLARLPNAPIKGLDAEEFVIEVNPRAIWLYGGSEAGAYFAVVTFLEHCGVRWLMPGKLGEFVPRKNKLTVAHMRIREKPGFVYRTVWYAYGGRPRHERLEYERWKRRNKMGGRHISMGHNLYSIYPPRRFAEDHPEYYPLINGRRAIPQTNAGWQPCTSNPEVVQIAIETARHHFDSHPDAWTYSLSPNDGYGWCECERCRIQDPPQFKDDPHRGKGRRMLIFANAVARALQESHPGKCVAFYAYAGTVEPPTDMRAEDNVIVAVAHYGYVACHYHPIEAQKCPANARFPAILEGWAKVAKRICIREYFTALPPISQGLLRIAKGYALARDIPYFKRNNAIAINSEAVKEWGSAAINFYLAAKLMWNPSANVDALLDDYYRTAYGPAEGVMRKYYETLVQRITARIHTNEQIFTPEFWNELERLLNEAQRIVANVDDEGVRARVQIAIDYFKLQRLLNDAIMKRTPQAYKSLMDFIEAHRDSLAFDYTMLRHRFLQPSTVRIIREVAKLRPIFEKADVKLPLRFPTVRGNHTFRLFIRAGEMIDSTVAVRQLGSYMQPTAFVLSDPSGREVMRGCATLAEPAKLNVKATVSGTWTLVVNSGSNGCVVTSQNRYAVLEGPQVHFLGATPKIYFYIPSGVDEAEISLRTSAPGETARLVVFNPDGNEVASGDTVSTSKCTLRFSIPQKYQGMVWSFRILPASRGTCEDNYINLGTMLPPYLGVHPKSLLISIH